MTNTGASHPRHRSQGQRRRQNPSQRRGLAAWVWRTPLAIVLVGGLVFGWLCLTRDSRDNNTHSAATECLLGDLTLTIWADPAVEKTASDLAKRYADTAPVVRDYCVHPHVEVKDTAVAIGDYRAVIPGAAAVWLPITTDIAIDQISELPGAPENPPVVATTPEGNPIPLVVFGSSPAVSEDTARAGADLLRIIAPSTG